MSSELHSAPSGLSPSRFGLSPSSSGDPFQQGRPTASTSATPSHGFTQTLPPVHEQPADPNRPTLVGFEQLTGEDLNAPGSSHGLANAFGHDQQHSFVTEAPAMLEQDQGEGEGAMGPPALDHHHSAPSVFRDPFGGGSRPLSPPDSHGGQQQQQQQPTASSAYGQPPLSASSHSHSFFNPQTVNPAVNTRNTRPMTAPSGPAYYASSYSAAPSSFYTHSQAATQSYDPLSLPPHPSSGASSTFQYHVHSNPNADYDAYRARGFSLPDVSVGLDATPVPSVLTAVPSGGSGGEDSSPTAGSTPFFYTPPATVQLRPVTAGATYYPTVLDPHGGAAAVALHPLMPATAHGYPTPSVLDQRPSSSGGLGGLGGMGMGVRRSSGSGGGSIGGGKSFNFVQQQGQATKRPRRRYDEIERLYNCDYPGCTKAYGTLNHLNSHKTMQKHGPKSTPAQFKEMRKAWRERKKQEAAAAARARAAAGPPADSLPNPALPSAFSLPAATLERPRPSTSAGEYHFTMPAPFLAPPTLVAAYPAGQGGANGYGGVDGQSAFVAPYPSVTATSSSSVAAGGYDAYPSALRPVTAPSYYITPAFGAQQPNQLVGQQQQQQPQAVSYGYARLPSGANVTTSTLGAAASADRRYSLPGSGLSPISTSQLSLHPAPHLAQAQHSPPEMKMPQPVFGFQPHGHAALISSGGHGHGHGLNGLASSAAGGVPSHAGLSLGMTTGGEGAAKLIMTDIPALGAGGGGGMLATPGGGGGAADPASMLPTPLEPNGGTGGGFGSAAGFDGGDQLGAR
ncbi:hypothetical protein JCM8097_007271 [Rhodosporidiobolus ruineniae]